jgi:DNA-binding transcriptional ArsR family regulator
MAVISPYRALADNTRRQILDLLRDEAMTAGVIADRFRRKNLSRPAVSKHLRILRQSRLVQVTKSGRERIYALNAEPLRDVDAWLQKYEVFWDQQLKAFKDYVESSAQKESQDDQGR